MLGERTKSTNGGEGPQTKGKGKGRGAYLCDPSTPDPRDGRPEGALQEKRFGSTLGQAAGEGNGAPQ